MFCVNYGNEIADKAKCGINCGYAIVSGVIQGCVEMTKRKDII